MAVLRSLLLLFVFFTVQNVTADCGDWIKYGPRCFKYFSEPVNFLAAQAKCVHLGGSLASVHNDPENDFLLSLLPSSSRCWIGGLKGNFVFTPPVLWYWNDGSRWDFAKWCPGEPNNNDGDEKCVEPNFSSNHCWNDVPCTLQIGCICARPF